MMFMIVYDMDLRSNWFCFKIKDWKCVYVHHLVLKKDIKLVFVLLADLHREYRFVEVYLRLHLSPRIPHILQITPKNIIKILTIIFSSTFIRHYKYIILFKNIQLFYLLLYIAQRNCFLEFLSEKLTNVKSHFWIYAIFSDFYTYSWIRSFKFAMAQKPHKSFAE